MIGTLHGPQGGSATVIDDYYKQYEDYEDEFPDQKRVQRLFDEALKTIQLLLPDIKTTRWGNRADFYTAFVGIASLLTTHQLPDSKVQSLRKKLKEFESEINTRLADEEAKVSRNAVAYVRAVEKGVNDKRRRADRKPP